MPDDVMGDDLERRSGVKLGTVQPFMRETCLMYSIFDNYNIERRHDEIEDSGVDIDEAARIIEEAMQVGEHKPEAMWWYDWGDLHVVRPALRHAPRSLRFYSV